MNRDLHIIALSGTNASGKDTVGEVLAERHGYLFIPVTNLLRDEARLRGLPVEREHLRAISAEWRHQYGLGVLVDRAVDALAKTQPGAYRGIVMTSLRNIGEVTRLHELGGTLVWVDADPQVRYARVQAANRGRAGEDNRTYEQFLAEQEAEMHPLSGADETALNMAAVRDLADIKLKNNGDDLQVYKGYIEKELGFV